MRTLFLVLVLCNVILFAVMQWSGELLADGQAVRAQPPLHEQDIRLLDVSQAAPEAVSPVSGAAAAPVLAAATCLEWGDFSGADLARATAALGALQLGDKLSQRQAEHNIGYWVYVPPLRNKAAVNQKIAQLKARGIKEYFVVTEAGQWLNAISLGVFQTQEAAQGFLDELRAKGVVSTRLGERAGKFKATVFVLSGLDAATAARLTGMQKDFHGSELKNISCAH